MSATTITPMTWTDDTGTFAAPNNDGTPINNAQLQLLLGNINALFTSPFVFGSTVSSEGLGTHSFSAGGAGGNILKLRNTTAGTGNFAQLQLDNDAGNVGVLVATSTTYTSVADLIANATILRGNTAGGLSIAATNASGNIRFYAAGSSAALAQIESQSGLPSISSISTQIGARVIIGDSGSATAIAVLQAGEPGVSASNLIVGNNYYATSGGASARRNTSIAGSFMRFGMATWDLDSMNASGTQVQRLAMDSSGNFTPGTDNAQTMGSASFRFSNIYGTIITSGDIALENGFAWTEHYKVGIETPGVVLVNPDGDVVAFVDVRGGLHVRQFFADLDALGWRRTTAGERSAM